MRKVCVVVTARPSYSRIKTALQAIRSHPELELQLVVAASALLDRYGNAVQVIERDGFEIAARVFMILEGENLVTSAKSTGLGLVELATVFDNLRPDVVVTIADRYETIATAIAASFMNLPLAHVQGGEVTGSIDEKVRHAVTKLANIHLVSTAKAAERVERMGERRESIHVTGCPSIDLATEVLQHPGLDFDPYQKYGGVGPRPDLTAGYLVVMQHPVTDEHQQARQHVEQTLRAIERIALPALWFWPNVDAGSDGTSEGLRAYRELLPAAPLHFFKNMTPIDFLRLIHGCRCLVGNSSVAIREASFLGIPAINIGSRQQGRERGPNVLDVDYNAEAIETAIQQQLSNPRPASDPLYGDGSGGRRIASALAECALETHKRLTF